MVQLTEVFWAWIFFFSAVFATYFWRFAAVFIIHKISSNHPIFEWFTCLSYGIIAALVSKTIFLPSGLLLLIPLWQRVSAMLFAFLGYYLLGKKLWIGIFFGETVLILLLWYNKSVFVG